MHYYKRNIGDYAKKAGRLSMLQHGAYTLLIDAIYDRERFPTLENAIDWTWASSEDEISAVQFILRKFFTLKDGVYLQTRIQEEFEDYRTNCATNARIAKERETKRAEKHTKRAQVVDASTPEKHDSSPNHKPLTTNQEPVIPLTPKGETLPGFAAFWLAWPASERKQAKGKCFDAWKRSGAEKDAPTIISHVERLKASEDWRKNGGAYIPAPLVYLNQRRWEGVGEDTAPSMFAGAI